MFFHKCDDDCKHKHDYFKWEIDHWKFNECPLKILDYADMYIGICFQMFEAGYLANSGGWMDQSNKFIQAMFFIKNEIDRSKNATK